MWLGATNRSISPLLGPQGAIKFHPGHYLWFDSLSAATGISRLIAAHASLKDNPNIKGYKIYFHVADATNAAGDYSGLASIVSQIQAAIAGSDKRYMLSMCERTFGSTGAAGTFTGGTFPTYWQTGALALISNASTNVGGVANMINFGNPAAVTAAVEMAQQVAALCDDDPAFECYDPMNETSITPTGPWHTGSSAGPSANFGNSTYRDAVLTIMSGASAAFQKTLVRLQTNFVPSNDNTIWQSWYNNLLPLGNVAFGGPDPPLILATGYTADAKFWQGALPPLGVTDFRGVRPRIGEVQEDGLGTPRLAGGTGTPPATAVSIIAQGQITNLQCSHMIWNHETFETVVFNDILNFINANPVVNPTPPSLGSWNTA